MVKITYFNHDVGWVPSYYIRISSARWLLAYTCIVLLIYIYVPKISISYAVHKPSVNNRDHQQRKRKLVSINNIVLVIAIFMGFLYHSFLSHIRSLDLILITKRLGRNCMSLYVPLLFLTMRPSPLPNVLYLNLVPIHKWLGRLLVFQALLHTILYTCLYYKREVLWKLKKLANLYGIFSMIGFIIIAALSMSKIRRKDYRIFYISHYAMTWMTVIMLQYHARPRATYYTFANLAILLFQIAYRLSMTRVIRFDDVEEISPSFKRVRIPTKLLAKKAVSPGCHLRINNKHDNFFKNIFFNLLVPLQHPYTIESLPSDDQCALIIKNGRFPIVKGKNYYVTGAFEPRLPFFNNSIFSNDDSKRQNAMPRAISSLFGNKDKKVIIVTGGSAVSFGLPILQILNAENYKCKMYWITRDLTDLNLIKKNYQNLEIFVTKTTSEEENIIIDNNSFNSSIDLEHNGTSPESEPLLLDTCTPNSKRLTLNRIPSNIYSASANEFSKDGEFSSVLYKNYDAGNDSTDEIDFTKASTDDLKHKKSQFLPGDNFRKPSTLIDLSHRHISSPKNTHSDFDRYGSIDNRASFNFQLSNDNNIKITIPKGLKVNIGRPTLGFKELLWLFNNNGVDSAECNGNNLSDEACLENIYLQTLGVTDSKFGNNQDDEKNDVLVIAAGPLGLVESTKNWAVLHNFQFYEEAFFL